MKTGVCTTDFENAPLLPADELFAKIKNIGFECVQFAFSSVAECGFVPNGEQEIPAVITPETLKVAGNAAAKYSLPIEVINGTFNMSHPDREVREEGLKRFDVLLPAAKELGCPVVSLCTGSRNRAHLWRYSDENSTDEAWSDMLDTVSRAVEKAEKYGITLAIESEAANIISTPVRARRIMDVIHSDKLKMILDCANLFHNGEAYRENSADIITHAFEVYGRDIALAHGKDIREGDGIDFCGTGLGIVDFPLTARLLKEYGFEGDMFLHGIYDENDMPRALDFWKKASAL